MVNDFVLMRHSPLPIRAFGLCACRSFTTSTPFAPPYWRC